MSVCLSLDAFLAQWFVGALLSTIVALAGLVVFSVFVVLPLFVVHQILRFAGGIHLLLPFSSCRSSLVVILFIHLSVGGVFRWWAISLSGVAAPFILQSMMRIG